MLAEVRRRLVPERVDVAAPLAAGRPPRQRRLVPLDRQDHLVDQVPRALVVDVAARAELRDREEARARQELVLALLPPPARQVRGERQAREVVAGEERLGGEVAVAVEVGMLVELEIQQDVELRLGFGPQPLRPRAVDRRPRVIAQDPVLPVPLLPRRAVEPAPALQCPLERLRDGAELLPDPLVSVTVVSQHGFHRRPQRFEGPVQRPCARAFVVQLLAHGREDLERRLVPGKVENVPHRLPQVQPRRAQPDGVEVRADQFLVRQVQTRGRDLAPDHPLGAAEEVLVMGAAGGAVGEHERRLAAPTRAAGPLRVVGGGRRDVAEAHDVELRDVHPQLHGGRAEHDRAAAPRGTSPPAAHARGWVPGQCARARPVR